MPNAKMALLDTYPELRTASMLLAPTLEEHWKLMCAYFDASSDVVADVGAGEGLFGRTFTGVSYNIEIDTPTAVKADILSTANTLLFHESIGYMSEPEVQSYLTKPAIHKIVIKDLYGYNSIEGMVWSYDFSLVRRFVVPALLAANWKVTTIPFNPNKTRWKQIVAATHIPKKLRITVPDTPSIIVIAERVEV